MRQISHLFLKNDKNKPFVLKNDKIRHFLNYFSYFSYKNAFLHYFSYTNVLNDNGPGSSLGALSLIVVILSSTVPLLSLKISSEAFYGVVDTPLPPRQWTMRRLMKTNVSRNYSTPRTSWSTGLNSLMTKTTY